MDSCFIVKPEVVILSERETDFVLMFKKEKQLA